jgi:hypothetical protein
MTPCSKPTTGPVHYTLNTSDPHPQTFPLPSNHPAIHIPNTSATHLKVKHSKKKSYKKCKSTIPNATTLQFKTKKKSFNPPKPPSTPTKTSQWKIILAIKKMSS